MSSFQDEWEKTVMPQAFSNERWTHSNSDNYTEVNKKVAGAQAYLADRALYCEVVHIQPYDDITVITFRRGRNRSVKELLAILGRISDAPPTYKFLF